MNKLKGKDGMTKQNIKDIFNIEDILELPSAIKKLIEDSIEKRNEVYQLLLELNNYDLSYDWFQKIYEDDFAQRKSNKQDFTPNSVGVIASLLTNQKGWVYEPTAGNGSMIITDWWQRCLNSPYPIMHFPSDNMVQCVELSDRAIPFLLFNLSIRGIMGYVFHGDVLEQNLKAKYILLNRNNDTLEFSEVIKDEKNIFWIENDGKIHKTVKYY